MAKKKPLFDEDELRDTVELTESDVPAIFRQNIIETLVNPGGYFSKMNIANMVNIAAQKLDGHISPLQALVNIKVIQEYLSLWEERLRPLAKDDALRYGKGENKIRGVEFVVQGGSTSYNYDENSEYNELSKQIAELTKKQANLVDLMKSALKSPERVAIGEGGLVIEAPSVKKAGGDILKITIPK